MKLKDHKSTISADAVSRSAQVAKYGTPKKMLDFHSPAPSSEKAVSAATFPKPGTAPGPITRGRLPVL